MNNKGLPGRHTTAWTAGLAALALLAAGGWGLWRTLMDRQLLRAAPEAILSQPSLARYAIARGEQAYRRYCANCHGADLKGDARLGISNLVDRDWLYGSGTVTEIQQILAYGIRSGNPKSRSLAVMPAFAHPDPNGREKVSSLSPAEIEDLVAFLFSIEGRPADPAAASRGALLYSDKGVCYDCHSRDAQGDQAIGAPNLADRIWLYGDGSSAAVFRSIAEGRQGACPAFGRQLTPALLRAVAVFVRDRAGHGAKS